jgi:hypothetical protein
VTKHRNSFFARHLPVLGSGPEINPVLDCIGDQRLARFRVLTVGRHSPEVFFGPAIGNDGLRAWPLTEVIHLVMQSF